MYYKTNVKYLTKNKKNTKYILLKTKIALAISFCFV